MTDAAHRRLALALLVLAVLAVHAWLLGGIPRPAAVARTAPAFHARTVEAPAAPPVTAPAVAGAEAAAATPAAVEPRVVQVPAKPVRTVATAPAPARAPVQREAPPGPRPDFAVAPPSRWHYEVIAQAKGITLRGTAVLDWRHDGREYEAQLAVSAPFLRTRTQRSTGLVTAQGLAPLRFSDRSRSEEAVHFDRDAGKVVFSANKPEVPLEAGAQDRLSVILQLGAMFAAGASNYPPGTAITVQTASARDAEPWTFIVEGPQTLDLPGGRVPAVHLTRSPRREYDVKVELWLAPGAAYGPVRLRLTQPNGDWVDQQWSSTDRG